MRSEKFEELIEKDQLHNQMMSKAVFHGFKEGTISFMPTFKVDRQKGHSYNPRRLPAWCDRVLWKSTLPSREAQVLDYYSVPEVSSSDHKPVAALFKVPTSIDSVRKNCKWCVCVLVFYDHSNTDKHKSIIVLAIKKLQAEGLFLLKKTDTITATPPNPQVVSQAQSIAPFYVARYSYLFEEAESTRRQSCTRNVILFGTMP